MTDLLNIKEAAFKLGMTSAELKKLVRENKVPFVELPNGIRFVMNDLQNWINSKKGGDMPATAEKTERQRLQEHLRKRPEYLAEIQRLTKKQAEIQAQVNNGELTIRALCPIETKLDHLRGLLNRIDNTYRNALLNSCENEDLNDEWFEFTQQFQTITREREKELSRLEETENSIRQSREQLENLTKNALASDKKFIEDTRSWLRRYEKTKASQKKRIDELAEQIETIQAEKARVRELMIFDGEAAE